MRNVVRRLRAKQWCLPALAAASVLFLYARPVASETIHFAPAFASSQSRAETRFIDFGTPGARSHMLDGFSTDGRAQSTTFVWSLGRKSVVQFVVSESGPRQLVISLTPLRYPAAPEQVLNFRLNGEPLTSARLSRAPQKLNILLPGALLRVGDNRLQVTYSDVRQPVDVVPNSSDPRELAASWDWLRIVRPKRPQSEHRPEPSVDLEADPSTIALPEGYLLTYYARIRPGSEIRLAALRDLDQTGAPTPERPGVAIYVETDEEGRLLEAVRGVDDLSSPILIPVEEQRIARIVFRRAKAPSFGILQLEGAELHIPDAVATSRERSDDEAKTPASLRAPGANVVLYVIDTLRADSLGAYGNELPISPRFDRLARDGILFENALAVSSWTRPTVVSMLTGLRPSRHGVVGRKDSLAEEANTLAEILSAAGYRAGGFITNVNVSAEFGVSQGFAVYEWYPHGKDKADGTPRSSVLANEAALRWVEGGPARQPFLALVHVSDPHGPYLPPKLERDRFASGVEDPEIGTERYLRALAELEIPQSEAAKRDLEALYLAEVAYTDARLGDFLDGLGRLGRLDDTLVIAVADHGEEFFDHGWSEHGKTLYAEQIHVPMVMRLPGRRLAGQRIDAGVRQVDVLPTVLDLLGIDPVPGADGRSLLPLLAQGPSSRPALSFASLDVDGRRLQSVTEGHLKLIEAFEYAHPKGRHPGLQLFDLEVDPGEKNDISAERPIAVGYLQMKARAEKRRARQRLSPGTAVLDEALEEELRVLGYIE